MTEVSGISPRVCEVVPNILWKERRVPRVSRIFSEWFREVPDDPGSVRYGPGSVRNGFGHIWKVLEGPEGSGILWKVPEGSGMTRAILGSPEGSIIGVSTFALKGKESYQRQFRICKGSQFLTRF